MRVLRALWATVTLFAIAGLIVAAQVSLVVAGFHWFGQWGPVVTCLPAMFIGFFLLVLTDRTFR